MPITDTSRLHVRWMIRRDMPEVMGVERDTQARPWDEVDFLRCLRLRNCIGQVVEVQRPPPGFDSDVTGFLIYETLPAAFRVIRLGVAARFRRCGVGRALVEKLKSKFRPGYLRSRIVCTVSEYDLDRQLFLKALGFACTGALPDGTLRFAWRAREAGNG